MSKQYFLLNINNNVNQDDLAVLNEIIKGLSNSAIELVQRILVAIVVFFIISWLIKWVRKGVKSFLTTRKIDETVKTFLDSVVNIVLKLVLVLSIVSILGISTTSFTAILAAAGLAVGMAMKDNLSNFAGGVMLLVNKPFKMGDRILAQTIDGEVQAVGILYTTLLTADNRTVYIPNGPLSTGTISNYSRQQIRRIDRSIIVKHGVKVDHVKNLFHKLFEEDARILKTPLPFVGITNMTSTTIDLSIRVWVKYQDFEDVTISINERIYAELLEEGIYQ